MYSKLICKDKIISIRCTADDKQKLERYAQKEGKSLSEYLLDCGNAKYERHRSKDRKQLISLIETQELLNTLIYKYKSLNKEISSDSLLEILYKIYESENTIWPI